MLAYVLIKNNIFLEKQKKAVFGQQIKNTLNNLYSKHFYFSIFFACIAIPILTLLAVSLFTAMIVLPISLLMGWI